LTGDDTATLALLGLTGRGTSTAYDLGHPMDLFAHLFCCCDNDETVAPTQPRRALVKGVFTVHVRRSCQYPLSVSKLLGFIRISYRYFTNDVV